MSVETEERPTLKELKELHRQRTEEMRNLIPPFKKAVAYLDSWVQKNFKTSGGLVGGWEPFKYGGRVTSKGIDTSAKLLMDTGRLRASFLPFATRNNAGIGSELIYSAAHNEGIGVPKRRILPEDSEVKKQIMDILDGRITEVYKK